MCTLGSLYVMLASTFGEQSDPLEDRMSVLYFSMLTRRWYGPSVCPQHNVDLNVPTVPHFAVVDIVNSVAVQAAVRM
jgi:hypothetical protein